MKNSMINQIKKSRSEIMASIRSKNTKPELIIRKNLHKLGFRFRLHETNLPGSPDIVMKKFNAVIFVNGCFWHGHNCQTWARPKSNINYWMKKIERNKTRDLSNIASLRKMKWRVLVVWQCSLKNKLDVKETVLKIVKWINSNQNYKNIPNIK